MNSGFSNLSTLRLQLLGPDLANRTDWDAALTLLGTGIAAQFENFCNRKFARQTGDQFIIAADRCQFALPRTPVEAVTLVEMQVQASDGFLPVDNSLILSIDYPAGIVNFSEDDDLGPWYAQVRFTYTGGYFWEQLEPSTNGYPTAQPAGSAVIPPDLVLAWILQCRKNWEAIDKLGINITTVGSNARQVAEVLAGLDLIPAVKATLGQFIRPGLI